MFYNINEKHYKIVQERIQADTTVTLAPPPDVIILGFLKWPTVDHRSIVWLRLVAIIYDGDFNDKTWHKIFAYSGTPLPRLYISPSYR